MRRLHYALPALAMLVACRRDLPRATGTLVFDPREAADVFLATEAEVLRSDSILRVLRERDHVELAADAIHVSRRSNTMILDVAVDDKDPARGMETCNRLMQAYLEARMERSQSAIMQELQALSVELEKKQDARTEARITELELQRQMAKSDVHVLAPCRADRR